MVDEGQRGVGGSVSECIFCDIVAKQAPASVVYEDDSILGFMDLYPATTGHVLVIPKAHVSNLAALPQEEKSAMLCISRFNVRG